MGSAERIAAEMGNMEPQRTGQQWLKRSGRSMTSWDQQELIWMARAVSEVEVRHSRVCEVTKALERGTYRVSAQVLAASLMLEMLR